MKTAEELNKISTKHIVDNILSKLEQRAMQGEYEYLVDTYQHIEDLVYKKLEGKGYSFSREGIYFKISWRDVD